MRPDDAADRAPECPADPVVDAYKAHLDRTLIRENLKLTPDQRIRKLQAFLRFLEGARSARRERG